MSGRPDQLLLIDICEAIGKIETFVADMTEDQFSADARTVDAVIRNLEVIGEAAGELSPQWLSVHPSFPVRQIVGLRNRLIHGYFGVSIPIVWQVVKQDIPVLRELLRTSTH
jgi:uncharacterized protein with HEPN domain